MTKRVAVVGAGISGLSASYHLPKDVEVTLYEKDDRLGGHACTIEVEDSGKTIGIDTAFVVFNNRTYPQISEFFAELGVEALEHHGGFNFFDVDSGLNYGSAEFECSEEDIASRFPASFMPVWRDAERFHREAPRDFLRKRTNMPLGEYLDVNGYSEAFKYSYVVLLATAVWSVPAELIWEMPATTIIAFYMSHDQGGLGGKSVAWRTVGGGSINYVRAIERSLTNGRALVSSPVTGVREDADGVVVATANGAERYDYAIVASHADQTLQLLESPTARQIAVLEKVKYSSTEAILHTDARTMSPEKDRWMSWNYGMKAVDGATKAWVAYYMNKLQGFEAAQDYFVTLDCPIAPREETIIKELPFTHPIINMSVRDMQKTIYQVNEGGRVKLAGSYFHSPKIGHDLIGSHEAGFVSGLKAAGAVAADLRAAAA